jgi:hypothetical protein
MVVAIIPLDARPPSRCWYCEWECKSGLGSNAIIISLGTEGVYIHKTQAKRSKERVLTTMYPYTPMTLGLDDADLGLRLELEKERSWILGWIIFASG